MSEQVQQVLALKLPVSFLVPKSSERFGAKGTVQLLCCSRVIDPTDTMHPANRPIVESRSCMVISPSTVFCQIN